MGGNNYSFYVINAIITPNNYTWLLNNNANLIFSQFLLSNSLPPHLTISLFLHPLLLRDETIQIPFVLSLKKKTFSYTQIKSGCTKHLSSSCLKQLSYFNKYLLSRYYIQTSVALMWMFSSYYKKVNLSWRNAQFAQLTEGMHSPACVGFTWVAGHPPRQQLWLPLIGTWPETSSSALWHH